MEKNNASWQHSLIKVCTISVLALLMMIPLGMSRRQIKERADYHAESLGGITKNWGGAQTFSGPWLSFRDPSEKDKEGSGASGRLYPDSLTYVVDAVSQELHRSIYDVSVYTADLTICGHFVLDEKISGAGKAELILNLDDLKGVQGNPSFVLGGKELKVRSGGWVIKADVSLDDGVQAGDLLPFRITMKVNGSESLFFAPLGDLTEVVMTSDAPAPSFGGDFLPVERDVRADGFTAKWSVSQLTTSGHGNFGVRFVKPVTQYRQTERATKYGILVIFLVFLAGFVVEIVSKRAINLIQYLVIAASLVLFYSLLLAFSDFLAFGLSYLLASAMTCAALGGYFMGIVKDKWAYLLSGLVASVYGVIYVLLQMETYAFLAGTLLIFLILCMVMLLTRNLRIGDIAPAKKTTIVPPAAEPK